MSSFLHRFYNYQAIYLINICYSVCDYNKNVKEREDEFI